MDERRTVIRRVGDRTAAAALLHAEPLSARFQRVSWGAIFAGVVVAVATQILLAALGLAVGLASTDPTQGDTARGFGIGAGVWWLLSGLLAMFFGGWTAGRLANVPRRVDGGLHGLVTWGLATLFGVWLLTSALGGALGGAWSAVSTTTTAAAAAAGRQPDMVDRMAGMMREMGVDPSRARETVDQLRAEAQQPGRQVITPQQEQRARRAADDAKDAASTASWFIFGMLLLGAAASTFGGMTGSPRELDESVVREETRTRTSA
jgi:hypothetical protein